MECWWEAEELLWALRGSVMNRVVIIITGAFLESRQCTRQYFIKCSTNGGVIIVTNIIISITKAVNIQ